MQCNSHCDFLHLQPLSHVADRLAFKADGTYDLLLAAVQPIDEPLGILPVDAAAIFLHGQRLENAFDRHLYPPSAPAQRIDELMTGDGSHPRPERLRGVPGVAL